MAKILKFSLQMSWPILVAIIGQTWYAATEFQTVKSDIKDLKETTDKVEVRVMRLEDQMWK